MKVPPAPVPKTNSAPAPADKNLKAETNSVSIFSDNRSGTVFQRKIQEAADEFSGSNAIANKNGLPAQLQSGIESLSGISMQDVKVHYNSSAPAQLHAHAYALGTDIHVAPGQEKHLPHEAWHVVQQKQGRVQPTMQLQSVSVNDNASLEQEADLMGNKALQFKAVSGFSFLNSGISSLPGTVQLMPKDAIATAKENLIKAEPEYDDEPKFGLGYVPPKDNSVADIFSRLEETIERLAPLNPTGFPLDDSLIEEIRIKVAMAIQNAFNELGNYDKNIRGKFLNEWNKGLGKKDLLYITKDYGTDIINGEVFGFIKWPLRNEELSDEQLGKWYKKETPKKMSPTRKLAKMFKDGDGLSEDLPEDFWVAIKQFFVHTAPFDPENDQGRDMREDEGGGYYRSTDSSMKDHLGSLAKKDLVDNHGIDVSRKTVRPTNEQLFEVLQKGGKISSNHESRQSFQVDDDVNMQFALFKSAQGSHTGSLGVLTNAVKAMRIAVRLQRDKDSNPEQVDLGNEIPELTGLVEPELLASATDENYHDFMLRDRGELVAEVTGWMNQDTFFKDNKIEAIQSEEHPSIILYHADHADSKNEQAWRDLIMNCFNEASADFGFQTQLNRRSSFGFLYPTASSVGGPVRIWPGLVPRSVFMAVMKLALQKAAASKAGKKSSDVLPPFTFDNGKDDEMVHVEALKTAVLHAYTVLNTAISRPAANSMYTWIINRLRKNLQKARFLLQIEEKAKKGLPADRERHYLKSASVIENLMEYSYLFTAFTTRDESTGYDSYSAHAADMLLPYNEEEEEDDANSKALETYYLDSGMQAIAIANLLAKEQLDIDRGKVVKQKKKKAQKIVKQEITTLDVNSYFEYSIINKGNLQLGLFDPKDDVGAPDIISADLNPVLTSPGAKTSDPETVLDKYQESVSGKTIIPIIDITNSTLGKAAELDLGGKYTNFIILESLSKHQQLGADKFTMGRLVVVGTQEFLKLAEKTVGPVANGAYDPLWMAYRQNMDEVFYGEATGANREANFAWQVGEYNDFMMKMGKADEWLKLTETFSDEENEPERKLIKAAMALLQNTFSIYVKAEISGKMPKGYHDAFAALPSADKSAIMRRVAAGLGIDKQKELPQHNFDISNSVDTGIVNVGNTCYLSAGLNLLAFTSYRNYLVANEADGDNQAELRAALLDAVATIRNSEKLDEDRVTAILEMLRDRNLLPPQGANALGIGKSFNLHAQQDPNEVFLRKIMNYLQVDEENGTTIRARYETQMALNGHVQVQNAVAANYTSLDENRVFSREQDQFGIELPINQQGNFQTILRNYFADENIPDVKFRGDGDQVFQGPARRHVLLGNQAPVVLNITLMRWFGAQKDRTAVNMPTEFRLNGYVYRLQNVIYHLGATPDSGHYTSSNRNLADNGWEYRNDETVSDDDSFEERKNTGYIYTYVRVGAANPEAHGGLIDIKNPG